MADFAPISGTTGPFDTAAMQIAQARARAAAGEGNEEAFLQEMARTNEETNATALDGTPATPPETFFNNALLNLPPSEEPVVDPDADPADLPLFTQFGVEVETGTSENLTAQQLHDLGVLQKDAELLEEAANANTPIPLGPSAATVDLSLEAQALAEEPSAPTPQEELANIVRPLANEPLTPELLQQIQGKLALGQNSLELSLNTLAHALIASMQPSTTHVIEKAVPPKIDNITIAPVLAIEDSVIGHKRSHA